MLINYHEAAEDELLHEIGYLERRANVRSALGPIDKIGFFHFGSEDKSDPIKSLAASLEGAVTPHRSLTGLLLVLPEAFNIRNDCRILSEPDPSVVDGLRKMSEEHGIAIVAGLVERTTRHSCAYLIDGDTCRLLSRKSGSDGSPNYKAYEGISDKPCRRRGVWIAAPSALGRSDPPLLSKNDPGRL